MGDVQRLTGDYPAAAEAPDLLAELDALTGPPPAR
jgi:hypothetical protein